MHLRNTHLRTDLCLCQFVEEPQHEDPSFPFGQRREEGGEGLAVLDQIELGLVQPQCALIPTGRSN